MSNPRGRPRQRELVVSPEQKIALRQLRQQPRSSRSLAFRARIVLECASGESNAAVAAKLRTTGFTVGMWRTKEIRAWFLRHARYHLHFTPTHSSWLNQVERWFALLSQRQIKRASHYSVRELEFSLPRTSSWIRHDPR